MAIKFGWIPDKPDKRDRLRVTAIPATLPSSIDLRKGFPAPYDQGELGSCTANAIAGALEFDQIKQKLKYEFTPSRLFIYYNERVIEGQVDYDAGAAIRDGIKSVNAQGACPESDWPYNISKFADKPTAVAYKDAKLHKALQYERVSIDPTSIKTVLATGFPVVFGFTVYQSFMTPTVANTGVMPVPDLSRESVEGGHAVVMAGYNDASWIDSTTKRPMPPGWIVRNSWGTSWGCGGYFVMPYMYADPNLSDDYWHIDAVK